MAKKWAHSIMAIEAIEENGAEPLFNLNVVFISIGKYL